MRWLVMYMLSVYTGERKGGGGCLYIQVNGTCLFNSTSIGGNQTNKDSTSSIQYDRDLKNIADKYYFQIYGILKYNNMITDIIGVAWPRLVQFVCRFQLRFLSFPYITKRWSFHLFATEQNRCFFQFNIQIPTLQMLKHHKIVRYTVTAFQFYPKKRIIKKYGILKRRVTNVNGVQP